MRLFPFFRQSNRLYFPGSTIYLKYKGHFELYKKIFSKLGIDFKILEENNFCGLVLLEAGYEQEARKVARKNLEKFREEGIKSIITASPSCYKMFLQNYPELLPDWDIKVENIWEIILERLMEKPRVIREKAMETVSYHDPCYLGRHLKVYDSPRKILELIGYEIREMEDSKERAVCCGSCGGLPISNPKLANEIAKQRILQAKRTGVKKLIVSSIDNYDLLKKNCEGDLEILELSEVLALALGIELVKKEGEEAISGEESVLIEQKKENPLRGSEETE